MTGDVERQRAHFESIASTYLRARQDANHLHFKALLWRHALRDVSRRLNGPLDVLEPMCGYAEGKTILETNLSGPLRYTGFDFSRSLVAEASARFPASRIFYADVTTFRPDRHYDLVIIIGGLHHVYSNVSGVLRRISASLRPGGLFINFEPTHNNSLFAWIRGRIYRSNPIFDDATEQAFSLGELNGLFADAGLEIVDQLFPGLLTYVLYYNPDAFPGLNRGARRLVDLIYSAERRFYRSWPARKLSFATLTLLRKPA